MRNIIFTFILIYSLSSCAAYRLDKSEIAASNNKISINDQNEICTVLGNGRNFDVIYITFGYSGNYNKAPVDKLRKKYGSKLINDDNYPLSYSTTDILNKYFDINNKCEKSKYYVVIDDVELIVRYKSLGKMGSTIHEYYLVVKTILNGQIKRSYEALSETKKFNAFISNKNFDVYQTDAQNSAFHNISQMIKIDLEELQTKLKD